MDYLVTAQALNESYAAKDWERFCKFARPVAVAAARERLLTLFAPMQRSTPSAQWFAAQGKYQDVPKDFANPDSHQLGLDRFYARQEAEDVAHEALADLVSKDLSFRDPDRMYRVVQARARFAADMRFREEHGAADRGGRLARQEQWFVQRYAFNCYEDEESGEQVQEVVDRHQPEQLQELADLEEAQLVRDTLLSSKESWAEVLSDYYVEGVPADELQQRYGVGRRGFYKRLASAREALQSSLSTSARV